MSRETTPMQRGEQVIRLLDDKVVNLSFKESTSVIYNWIMYEVTLAAEIGFERRRAKYGRRMSQFMDIANFKHDLEKL